MEDSTQSVSLDRFTQIVKKNKTLLSDWAYSYQDLAEEKTKANEDTESEFYEQLKNELLPAAKEFAYSLSLSEEEIETMTGEKIESDKDYDEMIVGILLFSTTSNCCLIEDEMTRGGSFADCFLEATGIAAGMAIVGGMTKGAMSKAALKAVLKVVARVSTRTLNGVDLALLAGEIAWCMW